MTWIFAFLHWDEWRETPKRLEGLGIPIIVDESKPRVQIACEAQGQAKTPLGRVLIFDSIVVCDQDEFFDLFLKAKLYQLSEKAFGVFRICRTNILKGDRNWFTELARPGTRFFFFPRFVMFVAVVGMTVPMVSPATARCWATD
jgi:hypothetical protein